MINVALLCKYGPYFVTLFIQKIDFKLIQII